MRTGLLSFVVLVVGLVAGSLIGAASAQDAPADPDDTVLARRYSITVHDSALDIVHAAGREIVELHFPGEGPSEGIVCNVEGHQLAGLEMNAFYGASRHDLAASILEEVGVRDERPAPEEIRVPRALFERIERLADLTRERARHAERLRADLVVTDLFTAE